MEKFAIEVTPRKLHTEAHKFLAENMNQGLEPVDGIEAKRLIRALLKRSETYDKFIEMQRAAVEMSGKKFN